jgi:kynurenine--oxoglutarate transaminase/cysteine-S-conjugate beta-lyase/glutamine--phenylpyruvate transaminase
LGIIYFRVDFTQLALKHKALNLGQGFPDYPPPKFVTDALVEVANSPNYSLHQYTREFGHTRLVSAIAKLYSQLIDREIKSQTEVLITLGAFGALFSSINGHVDVGDAPCSSMGLAMGTRGHPEGELVLEKASVTV